MLNQTLIVRVRSEDDVLVEVSVDNAKALVGSGSHCDVRLGVEQMATEQLFIELRAAGVFAEVRSNTPPVRLDGAPFVAGRIRQGSVVKVGNLIVEAEATESENRKQTSSAGSTRSRYLVYAAVGVALLAFVALKKKRDRPIRRAPQPPALFAKTNPTCSEQDKHAAYAEAEELVVRARGERERGPFYPEDRVAAVHSYRHAAACLEQAEQKSLAQSMVRTAEVLKLKVERAFHVHRVRLALALERRDFQQAMTEVRLLTSYMPPGVNDYSTWLQVVERRLEPKLSEEK